MGWRGDDRFGHCSSVKSKSTFNRVPKVLLVIQLEVDTHYSSKLMKKCFVCFETWLHLHGTT